MSVKNLKVALAQISPEWLDRERTISKMLARIDEAHKESCDLIVFSEGILPGYPFWLSNTDGARFNDDFQKDIHAHYLEQAVQIERGDLDSICKKLQDFNMAAYIGVIERPQDRGGHSVYCSLVDIDKKGEIASVHRKLRPTYEERLSWSPGDGHGLQAQSLDGFTVGGLNCWENWMPLTRSALYAQGVNVHIAVWPGLVNNTEDITRFIAQESRSYVLSVSSILRKGQVGDHVPHAQAIRKGLPDIPANGGSCIAAPDGSWLIAPRADVEELMIAELYLNTIFKERQNFDPSGHYARPDVTQLIVNKKRQSTIEIK